MSLWRRVSHGLRALTRRELAHQETAEELQYFFEQAIIEYETQGLSPQEARRRVRLELGGMSSATDQVHSYGWEHIVEGLIIDLRYAGRRLLGEPGFTAIAVLTIAIGIGATTAIFSVVNAVLLQPLPYPEAGQILTIWDVGADGSRQEQTFGTFRELDTRTRSFAHLAVMKPWQPTLSGIETPERIQAQRVSSEYFQVLGVPPAFGSTFRAADDRAGGPAQAILSDSLWRRRFDGDPNLIGRAITLDRQAFEVIGIMPGDLENVPAAAAELWAPLQYDISQGRAWGHHLRTIGRIKHGIDEQRVGEELQAIAAAPTEDFPRPPWASLEHGISVSSLQDELTADIKPALLALLGAAALVLAIAVVNVTNLLLARGSRRRGEIALRTALGAGQGRLIRQLLTESLMLAAMGSAAGMGVAQIGARALVALSPPNLPRTHAIVIDGTVFLFGLGLAILIGLIFGIVPALRTTRRDLHGSIAASSRRTAPGSNRTRNGLVVAEVALAVVLLVGSGLLLRSLHRLMAVDTGFDPSGLLTLMVRVSGEQYDDLATERFFAQILEEIRAAPGVTEAAYTSQLPLSGELDTYGAFFESGSTAEAEKELGAFRYTVSPGYIEAMGIAIQRGRSLEAQDGAAAPRVALISESMAKHRLPGLDPIGQRLRIGPAENPPYTVVGVVSDVRQQSLALLDAEAFYTTPTQWHFTDSTRRLVVRAAHTDVEALVPSIRQAIWTVDSQRPITHVETMDALVAASVAERRFALKLFEAFALASLILSGAGIYGVLAGSVAERTREIGARAALGASPERILLLVLRQGLWLTGLGALLGAIGAIVATRALTALLFEISRLDPLTYLGVITLVATMSTFACLAPAWRAARIDPATVLRAE